MSKRIPTRNIRLNRAHGRPAAGDGTRISIDRLWPRGVKKADAAIFLWVKDISPSTALPKWFGHDPARWRGFRRRYVREVHRHVDEVEKLRALARQGSITLEFSAHDELHDDAVALRDLLLGQHPMRKSKPTSSTA